MTEPEPTRILWPNGYCVSGAVTEIAETAAILREERDSARDLALILEEDHERLRRALADALDGMEDMVTYVPDFFRQKWDHDGFIGRARRALSGPDEEAAA